jgi:hypothetical protein
VLAKQLKCQSLHCGTATAMGKSVRLPRLPAAFGVRQRRTVSAAGERNDNLIKAQTTPVSAAIGGPACRLD